MGTYARQSDTVHGAQALGFDLGSGCMTAEGSLIFQSLIFLICKVKSDSSFLRDEVYLRYIRYLTQSRHLTNVSCSFLSFLGGSWQCHGAKLMPSFCSVVPRTTRSCAGTWGAVR